jgi:hypothetical protein
MPCGGVAALRRTKVLSRTAARWLFFNNLLDVFFLAAERNLSIGAVFLEAFGLGLELFQIGFALDAMTRERHGLKPPQRNLLLTLFANTVLFLIYPQESLIDVVQLLTFAVPQQKPEFTIPFR